MARTYQTYEHFNIRTGEDVWPMIERAEAVLLGQISTWGSGDFRRVVEVEDTSGKADLATVAEARGNTHRPLRRVSVSFWEQGGEQYGERYASAYVLNLDSPRTTPKRFSVRVDGPDEATAVGIAHVVIGEVKAARCEAANLRGRTWIAVTNHPWVVGIGSAVAAAAIVAVGGRVLG